ncbi:FAD-binding oxidoreductase [Rhodococcus sp. 15-725-2-2b]|uniref:FAD-binding oxidoreductase n=1 Tax=unclassified Rhodococcus (in: high G+C Gram-positive bacteria) TaxID=192944 RepID=UPI000B9B6EE3|nr:MULTISPECIES: FAD-linked oxidase C-terminal domain-containing protein [unclassified Rhodococcus (in: high G+C Gram-positive bacteria)]OZC63040.1 FAD-binding oxidoreductase [Rhodococcus sp. 06-469-3-2]OZD41440.1 FAD-binding oxidoreductase [Rhodococcus sp. 06-1477-1A]OZE65907.1 FAD-binding oxidoreductase [Rhodococcus sp. 15-725-2-2b]OZE65942.1 FAD-binding oxidoreductase [Rhodococcus sp. 15-725-2-2b]
MSVDVARDVEAIDALTATLPAGRVIDDADVMNAYAHDEAQWAPFVTPLAVVRPHTELEVQQAVKVCLQYSISIVPRGGGTGLSGGANATPGCIVLVLDKLDDIKEINVDERLAVVGPGVINNDLRRACLEQGLWYPPDPASAAWSNIGGNVATNAGGICCVKYGVTRDYVLSLRMVTGTGDVVSVGRRTAKGVAGYDLVGLLVGSEGTLGIITEVTVRLLPAPPPSRTVAGYFDSLVDAGRAVAAIATSGLTPAALELIDRQCLVAVDEWKKMGLSTETNAILLGRSDTPGVEGDQEAQAILECFEKSGATWAAVSTDPNEAEALFEARRLAYPAMERLGRVMTEDVCVPKMALPDMLARIEAIAQRHDTVIANVAHAGDGNLHPMLLVRHGDEHGRTRAEAAFSDIITEALELGGTVTGEHGVGLLKKDGLAQELPGPVMDIHRAIKTAMDPLGLFNPGKVF